MRNSNVVYNKIEKMTDGVAYEGATATYKGIGLKLLYYIGITLVGAILGIVLLFKMPNVLVVGCVVSGLITLICAIIAMSSPKASLVAGTIYCLFEGVFVGAVSLLFEALVGGIIITAVLGTLSIVLVVGILYATGLIKATKGFYKFLIMFGLGFILCSLLTALLSLFPAFNGIFNNFGVIVLVEVISLLLASFYLIADLHQATVIVENGSPKVYEWMAAFGLAYTVIWIYIQVLRLVAVIASNNKN